MPTVTVTFILATYVLETFVLFINILAIIDPILTKLLDSILAGPNFFLSKIFWTEFCLTLTFVDLLTFFYPKFFWAQNFKDLRFCGPKIVLGPKFFLTQNFLDPNSSLYWYFWAPIFQDLNFWSQIFLTEFFWSNFFWTQFFLDKWFFWNIVWRFFLSYFKFFYQYFLNPICFNLMFFEELNMKITLNERSNLRLMRNSISNSI